MNINNQFLSKMITVLEEELNKYELYESLYVICLVSANKIGGLSIIDIEKALGLKINEPQLMQKVLDEWVNYKSGIAFPLLVQQTIQKRADVFERINSIVEPKLNQ